LNKLYTPKKLSPTARFLAVGSGPGKVSKLGHARAGTRP